MKHTKFFTIEIHSNNFKRKERKGFTQKSQRNLKKGIY